MIRTIFWISTQRLWNNKPELMLALIIPILFFSIFALIFSRGVGNHQPSVAVTFIDDDQSPLSRSIVASVKKQQGLKKVSGGHATNEGWQVNALARALISRTDTDLVVHIPHGYMQSMLALPVQSNSPSSESLPTTSIRILDEGTNPVGKQVLQAILGQAVAGEFGILLAGGQAALSPLVSPRPEHQVQTASYSDASVGEDQGFTNASGADSMASSIATAAEFENENVFAYNKHQPKIAMYAAGIAIMFLLFSASGAGGSLLEEREAGTLERLLNSHITLSQLLLGKWLFITVVGTLQMMAMFAWGQIAFGVDLVGHFAGFFALAIPTAAAGASFALLLAATCKSRNQLNGVSVILVLSMSALGGSMIPRYIMSDSMQQLGKYTFNGWALDGFKKIFWYDLPLTSITTEVAVLCAITGILGAIARIMAERWSVTA